MQLWKLSLLFFILAWMNASCGVKGSPTPRPPSVPQQADESDASQAKKEEKKKKDSKE